MKFDTIDVQRIHGFSNFLTSEDPIFSQFSKMLENRKKDAIIRKREERIGRIKKLENQIRDLHDYLISESFLLKSDIEENSSELFPRFNGYIDFTIKGDVFKTFSECNSLEKQKNNSKFQFYLENFIWLFFLGQNFVKNDNVVEFSCVNVYDHGGYNYDPAIVTYCFNEINVYNGKSFIVKFLFYSCRNAHLEDGVYEYLQKSDFEKILITISEIPIITSSSQTNVEKNCKTVNRNFYDPVEIAAFINKTVSEGIDDGD